MQMLGGMIAGNPAGAYDKSRLGSQQVATGDAEATGDAAFGRALTALYGGGASQAPLTVPPGQPSMPMGGGPQGPMPGGVSPQMGGMPPGGPQMAGGGPPRPPMPMQPGGGMPQPGPGFPQGGPPPMGGGGPPMPMGQSGMPQGQPNFGQPGGGMTWQAAVQAVVRTNPGIENNPRAIARAVDHFMPIMNQQSLQQYREITLGLREDAIRAREETARMQETGRNRRFEQGEEGRTERTQIQEGGRQSRAETAEEGRNRRADQVEGGRQSRFETREQRLQSKADFDREFKTKSLDLATQRFAQTKTKQERDAAYREEKQRLDETHRVLREHISATAAGDSKAVKDLDASYKAAVKALDASFMGRNTNRDMKTGPGTPQAYPVPPDRRNDPDGTTYNNGQYKKQGDQIVPVQ